MFTGNERRQHIVNNVHLVTKQSMRKHHSVKMYGELCLELNVVYGDAWTCNKAPMFASSPLRARLYNTPNYNDQGEGAMTELFIPNFVEH